MSLRLGRAEKFIITIIRLKAQPSVRYLQAQTWTNVTRQWEFKFGTSHNNSCVKMVGNGQSANAEIQ